MLWVGFGFHVDRPPGMKSVIPVFTTSFSLCSSLNAIGSVKRVVRKRGDVEIVSRAGPAFDGIAEPLRRVPPEAASHASATFQPSGRLTESADFPLSPSLIP